MAVASPVLIAPTSLYVGDLHPDVTDDQLYKAFSDCKSLTSVRVCRDSSTRRSLCYGYVNFLSANDGNHAIETKNHTLLNGKEIRVMWSHRDLDAQRNGIGNVFVKNLIDSIDSAKLQETFEKFGNISSSKVVTFDDGKSTGNGFVQFMSEDSANTAIEKLNGTTFEGKQIYVGKFVKRTDRVLLLPNPDVKYTNLYMKNLDPDITEEVLREKFSEFGKTLSLLIAKDENGASKGFEFVNFENPDNAKRAMVAMNGSQLGTKNLYIARVQKKEEREPILRRQFEEKRNEQMTKYMGSNVYIKNISDDVTNEELRQLFSKCGTITSGKLMRDEKGISKGFGFMCFSNPEEASKAVSTFHGYTLYKKPLYVAIAQRKEDRLAQLGLQYAQRIARVPGPSRAVIPGGCPHIFYTTPSVVSQMPNRQGLMNQPIGVRPGWQGNGFASATWPPFQPSPVVTLPNNGRPKRQNRPRTNGPTIPHNGNPTQSIVPPKASANEQRSGQVIYVSNVRHKVNKKPEGAENLSSMLVVATSQQQKQIVGERLYPLVHNHKPELAAKITGMFLEVDNVELLLLLESPDSLTAKVKEALTANIAIKRSCILGS